MSFRKPCHMPFRKLIPPFTLTVPVVPSKTIPVQCFQTCKAWLHSTVLIHSSYGIHLFQLRLLPWTMFHSLQCTMVNQFCSGKLSLVHVPWNNGDHLWKGVQDSFQVQWLLKFFSMSELKNLIFKISWQKIRSGFYRLIKLRFYMGQPKMLVILIKQIHSILFFFLLSFTIIASKIDKHVVLVIYCCSTNALN